ncbi:hypothetical protein BDW22DRAFT_1342322 [Trametopsis cervina]|nr:hypothetical protein BDW22DRAFT_1342322 [Trametopsis cervina]
MSVESDEYLSDGSSETGASRSSLTPKLDGMVEDTDPLYVTVTYDAFMELLPAHTKSLSAEEQIQAGDFEALSAKQREGESYMCFDIGEWRSPYAISLVSPHCIASQCATFERTLKLSENGLTFKECPDALGSRHPAIVAYPKDNSIARKAWKYENKTPMDVPRNPYHARLAYAWAELAVAVSYKPRSALTRHRTHFYMICLTRRHARLLRWDRAGALVSGPIDLLEHPEQLLNFIHRFAQMSPAERGRDPTAILVQKDSGEFRRFRDFKPETEWATECHGKIFADTTNFPIYKVGLSILCRSVISTADTDTSPVVQHAYFLGKAMTRAASLTGRATRGFAAYDERRRRLVFFKDFWRPNSQKIRRELDTYALLNRQGVQNIATAIAGGDVSYNNDPQRTLTQAYSKSKNVPSERVYARLVLLELAHPLKNYFCSYELVSVVRDAIQAHKEAWDAGVLHRDISVANIMVSDDGNVGERKGILMDWELCRYREDMGSSATPLSGRAGTWAYISSVSLQYPRKPVAVSDDLESFLYVLEYCALQFHLHALSAPIPPTSVALDAIHGVNSRNRSLARVLNGFFYEESDNADGSVTGGLKKRESLESAMPFVRLNAQNIPVGAILNEFHKLANEHCAAIDFQELEKYGPPRVNIQPIPPPIAPPLKESTAPRQPPDPPKPKRLLLATHDAVLGIFQTVLQHYEASRDFNDRYFDQFHGLPEL